MLGIIHNEIDIVNDIISEHKITVNNMAAINLLIKYYYNLNENRDKLDIQEKIIHIMNKCDNDFERCKWEDLIRNSIARFFKLANKEDFNSELVNVEKIHITKVELENIENLNDKKLKKVAFALLCYSKISNQLLNRDDGWVSQSLTNIFKESKVALKGNDKQLLIHELYKLDYISQSNRNTSSGLKVNYLNEESEVAISIDNFDGVIYNYLNYIGERWKHCEICGVWIKGNKQNNNKYCSKCSLETESENIKKRVKKHRCNES